MVWLAMVLVLVLIVDLLLLCRYKHPKIESYTKSEKLVETVSTGLKRDFLPIFQHLYQIRKDEGVAANEGCMGNSSFTGISIIKDYHCSVHNDSNDFSYSFFIWLGDGKFLYSTLSIRNSYMFNISNISSSIYIYIYIQFYVILTYCMCCNRYYGGWKRSSFPST
jgi:hypothetical protein